MIVEAIADERRIATLLASGNMEKTAIYQIFALMSFKLVISLMTGTGISSDHYLGDLVVLEMEPVMEVVVVVTILIIQDKVLKDLLIIAHPIDLLIHKDPQIIAPSNQQLIVQVDVSAYMRPDIDLRDQLQGNLLLHKILETVRICVNENISLYAGASPLQVATLPGTVTCPS